jgi:Porin subfamily
MKMVKSLLLGSAAGLIAVTAGQAAELPVKAKPVQYVKICSLYGAGFYYMPGTDMCIKIGGWIRMEEFWGFNGNGAWGSFNANVNDRTTNNLTMRARGYITADAREQTEYGTARGYIAVGVNANDVGQGGAYGFSGNRGFVQWAGFTAGLASSFYDFYSVPAVAYNGDSPASDTGDPGWWVFGYTAQLGGGFSATIAEEQRRTVQIINIGDDTFGQGSIVPGAGGFGAYGGLQVGDIVGNLRVDQAWGGAQIMGALHQVNTDYYVLGDGGTSANPAAGHPDDKWGFAVGAGLKVNFPSIAPGDFFQAQFNYTEGALRYIFFTPSTNWGKIDGADEAYGVLSDCVYGGSLDPDPADATSCHLTTAWGFNASFQHQWTPAWKTSVYGGWDKVRYDDAANAMLCYAAGFGGDDPYTADPGCDNNWSVGFIGSRTQWNVTKSFYMGVDIMYENLHSATTGVPALGGYKFGYALFPEANQDNWIARIRMHKDFLP